MSRFRSSRHLCFGSDVQDASFQSFRPTLDLNRRSHTSLDVMFWSLELTKDSGLCLYRRSSQGGIRYVE